MCAVKKIGLNSLRSTMSMVVGEKIEKQGLRNRLRDLWLRTITLMSLESYAIIVTQQLVGMGLAPINNNLWKRTA